ncbi:efflux transporter outer membrane subunit [Geomonas sp. Red32]|uniref:efflux transporter outer membrane subunit n=1 Tax=Geomonas sp. Red32 TaxID=2912856 RepID=UPI00202CB4E3|nr:efflux transporter outer membrane subunit [Geomonas sp. Red32]MCM0083566.1 efflux transporter outer membrane subunit [Geomonas sp. Red32]
MTRKRTVTVISRILLLAALSLIFTGCAGILPRGLYAAPKVDLPETWQQGKAITSGSAVAKGETWWNNFQDPALSSLIERALSSNNDLAAAAIKVRRAQLNAALTGTNLTPSVAVSAATTLQKDLTRGTTVKSSGVTGTVSYELDLWGKLSSARDVSRFEAQATESDRRATALALIGTVATDYWQIAYLNERIATAGESIAYAEKVRDLVAVKYGAGAVTAQDLYQAKQTVASQNAELADLQRQRTEARNALAILFDQSPEHAVAERDRLPGGQLPAVQPGLPAKILARRPDLQSAEQRLRKYLAAIDNTRASYYPSFSLTGALGTSSTTLLDVLHNPVASLGAGITLPFIQWNTMKLNVEISRTDYQEAVVNFRQTLYQALADVENALAGRERYAEEATQLEESLVLAKKAESLAEIRYRSGATQLQSWLDTQESRRSAEKSLALNRLNRLKNQMTLYQSTGCGTD